MQFESPCRGVFCARPNRFVALCQIDGREERVHVKNTGRLRELLLPGAEVLLSRATSPGRSTACDLRCVRAPAGDWVCVDAQVPNALAADYLPQLLPPLQWLRAEQRCGESRFDFAFCPANEAEGVGYVEVKGVTLLQEDIALFPDAPTTRGVRHLQQLAALCRAGTPGLVLFVIQRRGARALRPNVAAQPAFAAALAEAAAAGVQLHAVDCRVDETGTDWAEPVPVELV